MGRGVGCAIKVHLTLVALTPGIKARSAAGPRPLPGSGLLANRERGTSPREGAFAAVASRNSGGWVGGSSA